MTNLFKCYIGPDLRIITNRNPAVYYGSITDDRIATKIRSWRYMDGGGDTRVTKTIAVGIDLIRIRYRRAVVNILEHSVAVRIHDR